MWKQNFPPKVKVFASSDQIIQIYSQHYINRNCHLCDADIDNITHLFFQLPCQAARPLCSFIAPKSSIPGGVLLITTAYFHLIFRIKPFNHPSRACNNFPSVDILLVEGWTLGFSSLFGGPR